MRSSGGPSCTCRNSRRRSHEEPAAPRRVHPDRDARAARPDSHRRRRSRKGEGYLEGKLRVIEHGPYGRVDARTVLHPFTRLRRASEPTDFTREPPPRPPEFNTGRRLPMTNDNDRDLTDREKELKKWNGPYEFHEFPKML